jgi:type IV pilus assembly protein PilP
MIKHLLQKNNRIYILVALVTVALLASGCNKKESAPVVVPPASEQSKLPVKAVQKPVSSSTGKLVPSPLTSLFDFSGKKDPFKPDSSLLVANASVSDDLKKALRGGLPIHSFDVSQFRLIGIVTGAKENQAMVVDPNGKGYVLKPGMTIGKNDGRITAINISGVDVVEQFKDDSGRVRKENIRISLPKKQ